MTTKLNFRHITIKSITKQIIKEPKETKSKYMNNINEVEVFSYHKRNEAWHDGACL
jgi:hypothetical protein